MNFNVGNFFCRRIWPTGDQFENIKCQEIVKDRDKWKTNSLMCEKVPLLRSETCVGIIVSTRFILLIFNHSFMLTTNCRMNIKKGKNGIFTFFIKNGNNVIKFFDRKWLLTLFIQNSLLSGLPTLTQHFSSFDYIFTVCPCKSFLVSTSQPYHLYWQVFFKPKKSFSI